MKNLSSGFVAPTCLATKTSYNFENMDLVIPKPACLATEIS